MVFRGKIKAKDLFKDLSRRSFSGDPEVEISGLSYDSRKVRKGDVFFCFKGENFDRHDFSKAAIEAGAVGLVTERYLEVDCGFQMVVDSARYVMARAASNFFGNPSSKFRLVGVTGTNGKTTTTYLLENIFRKAGKMTGLIGTVEYRVGSDVIPVTHTTPESVELQELFYFMEKARVTDAVMEVSSHSIDQRRIVGTDFSALIFTNLSQDHLDYHGDMETYKQVKFKLFLDNPDVPWIVNIDDESGKELIALGRANGSRVITYGINCYGDFTARVERVGIDGSTIEITGLKKILKMNIPLRGHFNVYNALAAAAAARVLDIDESAISEGLSTCYQVPGRFEVVDAGQNFLAVVDYAHSPDSLQKVLLTARNLLKKEGRLISVFGCGGSRDKAKRPLMGKVAAKIADVLIITSDNPRSEEPLSIIEDIMRGIPGEHKYKVDIEIERRKAIEKAVEMALPGDILVVAGKGHETYQIFKNRTIHFDDREVLKESIEKRVKERIERV